MALCYSCGCIALIEFPPGPIYVKFPKPNIGKNIRGKNNKPTVNTESLPNDNDRL